MIKNKGSPKRSILYILIITGDRYMLNIKKRKNNRLLVSLDNETFDTIIELSEKYDCSMSEIGRALIEVGLKCKNL